MPFRRVRRIHPAFFSASQRRTIGFALTVLAVLGSATLLILTFIVFGRLLAFFSSVIWPLAVAGVLALILRPVVEVVQRRLALRRLTAVILLYGAFVLVVGGTLLLLAPPIAAQLIEFVAYLPTLWEKAANYIQENYPQWIELARRQLANPGVRTVADALTGESRALFANTIPSLLVAFGGAFDVVAFFTHLAIIPVYLFSCSSPAGNRRKISAGIFPSCAPGCAPTSSFSPLSSFPSSRRFSAVSS